MSIFVATSCQCSSLSASEDESTSPSESRNFVGDVAMLATQRVNGTAAVYVMTVYKACTKRNYFLVQNLFAFNESIKTRIIMSDQKISRKLSLRIKINMINLYSIRDYCTFINTIIF